MIMIMIISSQCGVLAIHSATRTFPKSFPNALYDPLISSAMERTYVTCNAPNLKVNVCVGMFLGCAINLANNKNIFK